MKILFFFTGLFFCSACYACDVALPIVIPPSDAYGEFVYVPQPTEAELASTAIMEAADVAVVKVGLDWHQENYPYHALTQVELLHGWGFQRERVVKFYRYASSCGKPDVVEEGKWYIAIMENGVPTWLLPYEEYETILRSKGKPGYVYSNIGLLK